MPALPPRVLECVVYLYPDLKSAEEGHNFGGTGFIVGVPSSTELGTSHLFAVSNYHVAKSGGHSFIRVNKKGGGVDIVELDVADWHSLPNKGDVAAAPIPLDFNIHQFTFIPIDWALTKEQPTEDRFGIGDDVFMVGRFVDHDGGQTNAPALRFGNVSIEPAFIQDRANSDLSVRYFCLDMHSRSGSSGSPIFVYRVPGSDLRDTFLHDPAPRYLQPSMVRLLGIHCGQFPEEMKAKDSDTVLIGYSGMTYALPAWEIASLLRSHLIAPFVK